MSHLTDINSAYQKLNVRVCISIMLKFSFSYV